LFGVLFIRNDTVVVVSALSAIRPRRIVILALVERALHLRRPPARFGFGEAKLLFPTFGRLMPECPILRIDRVPFMLAAFFDLLSEELLPIKWHGAPLTEQGRLSPGDGLADLGLQMSPSSRQPLTARRSNPNVNCADARANQWRLIKSLRCCKSDTTQKYQCITATVFLLAGFATIRATMIGWFSYAQSDEFSIWPAARAAPLGSPGARLGRRR
jgi:hypothetical protein